MDPFLLKMQQINAITLILIKHFAKETNIFDDFEAELLTFLCIGEEGLNYHQSSVCFPRSGLTFLLLRMSQNPLKRYWWVIRGSAHVWKWSSLTEKQGQQRSGPVLTSLVSSPSPCSLLERNEISTEQHHLHAERPLAASSLSVWVCVEVCADMLVKCVQVCLCQWEHQALIQASDMWPALLPSHKTSANMWLSTNIQIFSTCTACSNIYEKIQKKWHKNRKEREPFLRRCFSPTTIPDPISQPAFLSHLAICLFYCVELIGTFRHKTIPTHAQFLNGDAHRLINPDPGPSYDVSHSGWLSGWFKAEVRFSASQWA